MREKQPVMIVHAFKMKMQQWLKLRKGSVCWLVAYGKGVKDHIIFPSIISWCPSAMEWPSSKTSRSFYGHGASICNHFLTTFLGVYIISFATWSHYCVKTVSDLGWSPCSCLTRGRAKIMFRHTGFLFIIFFFIFDYELISNKLQSFIKWKLFLFK